MTKWMRRAAPLGVAVLLAFGSRSAAAQEDDPGAAGNATPEEIQKSNGVSRTDTTTVSQALEEGRAATAASPENAGRSAPGVLAPPDDDLRAVPNAVTVQVTRGDTIVRLAGTLWLASPRPCASGTDSAKIACVAAARLRTTQVTVRMLELVAREHGPSIHGRWGDTATVGGSGAPVSWSARIPLGHARAGTYQGFLLFTRESEASLTTRPPVEVPVVVYVRDPLWWTLLLLFVATALFFGLRWYRDHRLKEHTSYVQIADAEALILSDPHLAAPQGIAVPFRERFASHLRAAAALVENPSTDHAPEKQLRAAEDLWVTWQAGHPNWLAGLDIDKAQIQALATQANARAVAGQPASPHLDRLLAGVRKAYESAPDVAAESSGDAEAEGASADAGAKAALRYRRQAAARALKGDRYTSLLQALAIRRAEAAKLSDTDRERRLKEIDDVAAQWEHADPDAEGTDTLAAELIAKLDGTPVVRLPAEEPDGDDSLSNDDPGAERGFIKDTQSELVPRRFAARIATARQARRTYALVVSILVFAAALLLGLRETWGSDPSFGDNWLEDYLEVFLWVMGANVASLATISAIAGQWSLPWLGKVAGAVVAEGRGGNAEAMGPAGSGNRPLRRF